MCVCLHICIYVYTNTHTHTYTHTHKEAATSTDTPECYDKVPKSVVKSELELLRIEKWQMEWDRSTKGQITKQYFPNIADRLKIKLI